MKNMSFFLTTKQYLDGTKDITRRLGWCRIKIGVPHMAVLKCQGLRKGESITKLGEFIPTESRWESLGLLLEDEKYGFSEVIREGFPDWKPLQFVEMFCDTHKGCTPETEVNRIVFRKVTDAKL